jgi:hypothetical protein
MNKIEMIGFCVDAPVALQQYDALVLADSEDYRTVFEYLFRSDEKEARETLIEMYVSQAVSMKGIFYSKKYNSIMFGMFEKQNRLTPNEFINRLKNTL